MDLRARIQDHDRLHERVTLDDLQLLVGQPGIDLGADSLGGIDGGGTFRAWARNGFRPGSFSAITVHLAGGVDPVWRGQGIGRQVLAWQHARAIQNVAHLRSAAAEAAEMPAVIGCFVEEHDVARTRLLAAAEFSAIRWFIEMRKPLDASIVEAPSARAGAGLPAGLTLDVFTTEISDQVRLAHNVAFSGHWGSAAMDPEAWRSRFDDHPAFRPDLSFVATDRTGARPEVVGYAMNVEFVQDWAAQGFTEGYTETLGVLPVWRGKGLAARLLEASARAFAGRGHPYAALAVDAGNPAALRLYQGLGYRSEHTSVFYGQPA